MCTYMVRTFVDAVIPSSLTKVRTREHLTHVAGACLVLGKENNRLISITKLHGKPERREAGEYGASRMERVPNSPVEGTSVSATETIMDSSHHHSWIAGTACSYPESGDGHVPHDVCELSGPNPLAKDTACEPPTSTTTTSQLVQSINHKLTWGPGLPTEPHNSDRIQGLGSPLDGHGDDSPNYGAASPPPLPPQAQPEQEPMETVGIYWEIAIQQIERDCDDASVEQFRNLSHAKRQNVFLAVQNAVDRAIMTVTEVRCKDLEASEILQALEISAERLVAEITQRILERANDLVIERLVNSLAARATSVDPEEAL
ncbi:hypothetical protein ANCDUO_07571 [Ancylostoma duodenale]|uniref:Uncharacterized protein n=1 Tax=Ancylostoma duodenale TaxID=51022 RepID=A0A0C2GT30_9BILA|nr:hypothetical protein ANCDUO_07571 [Ancylostoma duodenale]